MRNAPKCPSILAASVALLRAIAVPAQADSATWIGATDDWTADSNWSPPSFPHSATDLFYDGELGRKEYDAHKVSGGVRLVF